MHGFKKEKLPQLIFGSCAIFFFAVSIQFSNLFVLPPINISKQDSNFILHDNFLKFFSMGNTKLISSYLWIQTLLESDLDHYKGKDLNNWMFMRFRTISNLDPQFLEAYRFGGIYLSVIKDDVFGAKYIFDKGLSIYPNDYELNYLGGFHYYYELDDYKTAQVLLEKIMYHPKSPRNMPSIVAKLKSGSGDTEAAYEILKIGLEKNLLDHVFKRKFEIGLISLKIEIDLKCLNSGKKNCPLDPPEGYSYVRNKDGIYSTNKPFTKFELYKHHRN